MARRIAVVVALALLSVLMAATCAAGRGFSWAERNRFQVNDTLGMDAAKKICYLELKRDFCIGKDRATLNAWCSKDCTHHGYTRGGMCSDVTNICICQKPCAAEKNTDAGNPSARAREEAANAGDI